MAISAVGEVVPLCGGGPGLSGQGLPDVLGPRLSPLAVTIHTRGRLRSWEGGGVLLHGKRAQKLRESVGAGRYNTRVGGELEILASDIYWCFADFIGEG